jgi:hypothetical protein
MSKKNIKGSNRYNQNYEVNLPEVVNMDVLAYASDAEIRRQHDYLEEERARAYQAGVDVTPWEVELAYVQREVDVRRKRIAAHEKYLRAHPELFYAGNSDADFSDTETSELN